MFAVAWWEHSYVLLMYYVSSLQLLPESQNMDERQATVHTKEMNFVSVHITDHNAALFRCGYGIS